MAINKNHEFEELNGIKCGIVEKKVSPGRLAFLKALLEHNGYTVIAAPSPPEKTAAAPLVNTGEAVGDLPITAPPPMPATFTLGVTDVTFNPVNAIFGRLLQSPEGAIVTQAYWQQWAAAPSDDVPYYERTPTNLP